MAPALNPAKAPKAPATSIVALVAAQRRRITTCYRGFAMAEARRAGAVDALTMDVSAEITPKGNVKTVKIDGVPANDAGVQLRACVRAVFGALQLGPQPEARTIRKRYRFTAAVPPRP